ncbi:hypothetical protein L3V83_14695 [Thiotrichales bacterium 19X7-9]|nr:hypothetical protein [Thiotrichales bacterium 19X7-9]
MKLKVYHNFFILGTIILPSLMIAACKTTARVDIYNSCPFAINVYVKESSNDIKNYTIQSGDEKQVGEVEDKTITFTDGINNNGVDITNNEISQDYGKIEVAKTENNTSSCDHKIKQADAYGAFNDPDGFDDRSATSSGKNKKYTWHFKICRHSATVEAIGLGNIHIEKNNSYFPYNIIYKQPNEYGGYDSYDITFSGTTTACHVKYDYNGKYFVSSCDSKNIKGFFTSDNMQLVYICQQNTSSSLECPFLKSNVDSESYHYNYI